MSPATVTVSFSSPRFGSSPVSKGSHKVGHSMAHRELVRVAIAALLLDGGHGGLSPPLYCVGSCSCSLLFPLMILLLWIRVFTSDVEFHISIACSVAEKGASFFCLLLFGLFEKVAIYGCSPDVEMRMFRLFTKFIGIPSITQL